jgi:putative spermidine/putrescine transport system substrate-binding protein
MTLATAGPATLVKDGTIPEGSAAFVFDANMIGDYSYVAIPRNAPSPAAALVTANVILDPVLQAAQARPDSGFGLGVAIDPARVTDTAARRALRESAASRGPGATPIADLARSRAPEADPRYQDLIEQGWRRNVAGGR